MERFNHEKLIEISRILWIEMEMVRNKILEYKNKIIIYKIKTNIKRTINNSWTITKNT